MAVIGTVGGFASSMCPAPALYGMLHPSCGLLQPSHMTLRRHVGYYILFVGCFSLCVGYFRCRVDCCILHECYVVDMWAVAGAMWDVVSSVWAFTACMHAAQALYGLLNPLRRMLQPLCRMLLAKTGSEDRERRQEAKTGREDRERRWGTRTWNKDGEPRLRTENRE